MAYITRDFIKIAKEYEGDGDFSGATEAFGAEERIEYLGRYSDFLRKTYHLDKSKKAVDYGAVKAALALYEGAEVLPEIRKRVTYKNADIYVSEVPCEYKGWHFYGAAASNGAIIFENKDVPPTPSCLFEFGGELKKFDFRVVIGDDYLSVAEKRGVRIKPLITTVGKSIEFRSGTNEVARIQFYDNKNVYARVGRRDFYHHDAICLGEYYTDRENEISCVFGKSGYCVTLNGVSSGDIAYTADFPIDNVFVTGGMYSVGEWSFKPLFALTDTQSISDFFEKNDCRFPLKHVGKCELPYCLATHENADNRLIAKVNYNYCGSGTAVLACDSLNPCGKITINGKVAAVQPDFTSFKVNVTHLLKKGGNEIVLEVNPRAPEINYSWHRNKDPYVGWFLGEFYIDLLPELYASDLRIKTLKAEGKRIRALISFKTSRDCDAELYIEQSFPNKGERVSLGVAPVVNGAFQGEFEFEAEPWTTENPFLYNVCAELIDKDGVKRDDLTEQTGFRTIEQKNGEILLNGKRVILKGALLMQFLPPYENILKSHVCPTNEEIARQILQIKAMNGNTARLHMLGYGTNDARFAEMCDRAGVLLIWTTSLIDSLETVKWGNIWRQAEKYAEQMRDVINHPSIIMWEGSNEFHADKFNFDAMFDAFVSAVKKEDDSRLICPSSHVYYGGGLYGKEGFYYQDDGRADQDFEPAKSSFGWTDKSVIRSSHNYQLLLGYGNKWDVFRKQNWLSQPALLNSKKHAYIISEFAVIGRQDHTTDECTKYVKCDSYEFTDEDNALGVKLKQEDWRLSQAYQAVCADRIIKKLISMDADGMTWCCLSGGANDASYLKPPIDFYGYAKYAFYVMKDDFAPLICYSSDTRLKAGNDFTVMPEIYGTVRGAKYKASVTVKNEKGAVEDEKTYEFVADSLKFGLESFKPKISGGGYYEIEYSIEEVCDDKR